MFPKQECGSCFFLKHLDFFETSKMPCQIQFMPFFAATWLEQNLRVEWQTKPNAAGTTSRDALCYHSSTAERARGTECHWFCSGGGGTNGLEGGRLFLR